MTAHASSGRQRGCRNLLRPGAKLFEQNRTQVALTKRRQNNDNQLAGIFGATSDLQRGMDRRSRRDSYEKPFFKRKSSRHTNGLVVGDGDDLIDVVPAKDAGNKSRADALDFMR